MFRAPHDRTNGPFIPFVRPTNATALLVQPLLNPVPLYHIHRFKKRMVPCDGTVCLLCDVKAAMEYRCLFPAFDHDCHRLVIVDLPGAHVECLQLILDVNAGTIDRVVRIRRHGRENGPISVSPARVDKVHVCAPWTDERFDLTLDRLFQSNKTYASACLIEEQKNGFQNCARLRDLGSVRP